MPLLRRRLAWTGAIVAVGHAALIMSAWHGATTPPAAPAARMTARLVRAAPMAAAPVTAAAAVPVSPAARRPAKAPRVVRVRPPDVTARTAAQEPIVGVALGMLRIGMPGAAPARWLQPPPSPSSLSAAPPSMLLAQAMQAQAMREAGRVQIADALQRTLADAPADAADGACALALRDGAPLDCDNGTLSEGLSSRAEALAGLLRAYHSIEPRLRGLSIAVVKGRYSAVWDIGAAGTESVNALSD